MRILVNNKEAVLKNNTSFEYISENKYFTDSETYTLAITFPLKGCSQNKAIFGNINRKDFSSKTYIYNCKMIDKGFYKEGVITVTEIEDVNVKVQFLEGKSVQNFVNTLSEVYINELDLGEGELKYKDDITPAEAMSQSDYVALPWVNNDSGNLQNGMEVKTEDSVRSYTWSEGDQEIVSWCPYLIFIFKKICEAIEYEYDIEAWENSKFKNLLICNAVPAAWENRSWSLILPHWTVQEFFEEIEKLMNASINVDIYNKTLEFKFAKDEINFDNIYTIDTDIDDFKIEHTDDDESDYREAKGFAYEEGDNDYMKVMQAGWAEKSIRALKKINGYRILRETDGSLAKISSLESLCKYYETGRNNPITFEGRVVAGSAKTKVIDYMLCKENNKIYTNFRFERKYKVYPGLPTTTKTWFYDKIVVIGELGEKYPKQEDGTEETISIVPAWIDDLGIDDNGFDEVFFLSCGEYEGNVDFTEEEEEDNTVSEDIQLGYIEQLAASEENKDEYFSKIYVGYWDSSMIGKFLNGTCQYWNSETKNYEEKILNKIPHPIITEVTFLGSPYDFNGYFKTDYSLSLNSGIRENIGIDINLYDKFEIKFLAKEIPDVKKVFYIKGKRFLCKKITATFTEKGMSQLLKGEFYEITS